VKLACAARSILGDCVSEVTHLVTGGCVHEHVTVDRPICAMHLRWWQEGDLPMCPDCWDGSVQHECDRFLHGVKRAAP
jgi:hypothetical protein